MQEQIQQISLRVIDTRGEAAAEQTTQQLMRILKGEEGVRMVDIQRGAPVEGAKGADLFLGQLVVSVFSGAFPAVLTYIASQRQALNQGRDDGPIEIEVVHADGKTVRIQAVAKDLDQAVESAKSLIDA